MKPHQILLALVLLIIIVSIAWLGVRGEDPENEFAKNRSPISVHTPRSSTVVSAPKPRKPSFNSPLREEERVDPSLDNPFANEHERILRFADDAAYQAFLKNASKRGLRLLRQNSRLRAALVGYDDLSQLDDLDAEQSLNFVVITPNPQPATSQSGAIGFGASAVSLLTSGLNRSGWGDGITVAVIDSGVAEHTSLNSVRSASFLEFEGELNGHGTAVASIIAGDHPATPGMAPAAEILDIRITDSEGRSSSFALAEGIITAVEGGARVINVSLGSYGDAQVVRDAVSYAASNGAILVASAGNEGLDALAYPAAYPDVISVGAIDATGAHMDFSNQSDSLSIAAPGFQVNAAWPQEQVIPFSGTSASAPFVSGALAATMSEFPNESTQMIIERVFDNLNEIGPLGVDPQFGMGSLDLGRVMLADQQGLEDAAIASTFYQPPGELAVNGNSIVLVQNRGTTTLSNIGVQVAVNGTSRDHFINQLAPGETKPITVPTDHARATLKGDLDLSVNIRPNSVPNDIRPQNDQQRISVDLSDTAGLAN